MLKLSTAPAEYDDTPSPLANVGGGAVGHTPAFRVEPVSAAQGNFQLSGPVNIPWHLAR